MDILDKPQVNRYGHIRLMDENGDSEVAVFEPGVDNEAAVVAQDKLTKFLDDCIKKHGMEPAVFAKRIGEVDFTPFNVVDRPTRTRDRQLDIESPLGTDRIVEVETILIMDPLCGG